MQLPCQWGRWAYNRQATSRRPFTCNGVPGSWIEKGNSNRYNTNIVRCTAQAEAQTQSGTQVVDAPKANPPGQPKKQPSEPDVPNHSNDKEDAESSSMFTATIIGGIDKVSAQEWDELVASAAHGESIPFLSHTFLRVMEESESACRQTGWVPCHLLLRLNNTEPVEDSTQEADSNSGVSTGASDNNGTGAGTGAAGAETSAQSSGTSPGTGGAGAETSAQSDSSEGELVGAVPMVLGTSSSALAMVLPFDLQYLKSHSFGEYVYDSSWAQLSSMVGEPYYPKLQVCVPFSPVTCQRLLTRPVQGLTRKGIMRALGTALLKVAERMEVSGIHISFLTAEEAGVLEELGYSTRLGIQFHWDNDRSHSQTGNSAQQQQQPSGASSTSNGQPYTSFEDFLSALKQKKRKSIRQERKTVAGAGLRVRRLTGTELQAEGPAIWDKFHEMYTETVDRKWGNNYLTRKFFRMLGAHLSKQVLLIVAEEPVSEDEDNKKKDDAQAMFDMANNDGSASDSERAEPEWWGELLNTLTIKSQNVVRRSVRDYATAVRASPPPSDSSADPASTTTTDSAAADSARTDAHSAAADTSTAAAAAAAGSSSQGDSTRWRMVAASLNMIGSHALYGRNWAAEAEAFDGGYPCLHFELCYYQAQEEAIARGLPRVEAGAQGMHKLQRGYLPQLTYSSHHLRHPALRMAVQRVVGREQIQIVDALQELTLESSPYKDGHTTQHMAATLRRVLGSGVPSVGDTLVSSLSSMSTSTDSVEDAGIDQ